MDAAVLPALIGALALILGLLLGHGLTRRQRHATVELTRAQAEDLESQVYERLLRRLKEELATALADVDRLRAEVAELRTRLEQHNANEQRLLAEVASLREQLASAQALLAAKDQEIARLNGLVALGQAQHST